MMDWTPPPPLACSLTPIHAPTPSWIAKGRFYTEAEREAWGCALGLRSGLARRKSTAARNKSIREDPRINAELASEHGLTVRRIQQIRNQLGGGEMNYTDSVPLTLEKKREKILTFGPPKEAKPKPSL